MYIVLSGDDQDGGRDLRIMRKGMRCTKGPTHTSVRTSWTYARGPRCPTASRNSNSPQKDYWATVTYAFCCPRRPYDQIQNTHISLDRCQENLLLLYVNVLTLVALTVLAAPTCHPHHPVLMKRAQPAVQPGARAGPGFRWCVCGAEMGSWRVTVWAEKCEVLAMW